ncbi:MAG: heme o synthase [Alphaproteobacteria bacterium]
MVDTVLPSGVVLQDHAVGISVAEIGDYWALLKPRVMSLVVFTGAVGLVIAPGNLHPVLALVAILCIALSAGGSGAINMWYDRDIDAVMHRTAHRPIPAGRVAPHVAVEIGAILIIGSVGLMGLATNWLAAGLLAFAAGFYVFVYTMGLKRRTPQNIVIGGAAGAFPPMIGWVAVTGNIDLGAVLLFLLIFFWTPPHFWALALYRNDDYRRAGVPMLPVVAGARATKLQILLYTLVLFPVAFAPTWFGYAGWVYGAGALGLGAAFIAYAVSVWFDATDRAPRQMFRFSLIYLAGLFLLLLLDHLNGMSTW